MLRIELVEAFHHRQIGRLQRSNSLGLDTFASKQIPLLLCQLTVRLIDRLVIRNCAQFTGAFAHYIADCRGQGFGRFGPYLCQLDKIYKLFGVRRLASCALTVDEPVDDRPQVVMWIFN